MGIESSLNFRRVSETVTTSGTVSAEDLAQLRARGCDVVVNLMPDSSEYEGDEFEADYYPDGDAPDFGTDADAPTYASPYGEDGVD